MLNWRFLRPRRRRSPRPHGPPGAEIARFLHKQLPEAPTPHERTALASGQIETTDGQIDGGPALRADGGRDRDCGGKCDFIKNEAR
jgi:hypothetical protein